ncbi:short subunit dehydrogenase [Nocardia pseudobrasiliensis]|uniref:3-oxoacyl-[acyl-carrier-protein] reductase MabA n=2 Tax=Nocardia pseudobrasiliensis TaxID=45979 RepID=A0A370I594_9NOCA|nr:short subunit dehydrogenase [Nocardia pseudobrasiliensis]
MVVGSAGGVGREIALRLAEDGYSVVVCGRDGASVRETRQLIEWVGGRAVDVVVDLADSVAVDRLITEVFRLLAGEYGPRGVRINSVDLHGGGEPGAIAEAVRFLVSPRAAYVQGAVLTMSAGADVAESHDYSSACK